MLLERTIDAAAIDSTVLEMEAANDPSLSAQVRTITILGPSPAPPWIVHGSVPSDLRNALRREFLCMDKNPSNEERRFCRKSLQTARVRRNR
ncbi:MAG: hypothetical protein DMG14_25705 [Acidobacteria bacterium]|nr:MAG: hypothetical protein DMG14_25705 [Acidobacteriota bacterium]PYS49797.1 MAG: hypothetical protein DMG13_22560 [Acidobacteriota bacterium]